MSAAVIVLTEDDLRRIIREELARAPVATAPAVSEWLDRGEAAALLGVHVDTVRRLPGLPVHRVGRRVRFRRSEVEAWIQGGLR